MQETDWKKQIGYRLLFVVMSFFAQWVLWFAHSKFEFDMVVLFSLPLLICLLYHAVQYDSGTGKLFSRRFVFFYAALIPLLLSIFLSVWMYVQFPALKAFGGSGSDTTAAQETIAKYFARFTITSAYLFVFSVFDAIYFLIADKHPTEKNKKPPKT